MSNLKITDQFSRTISYLRLSLTDRCNLRCQYCMPTGDKDENDLVSNVDLLSYEEIVRIVKIVVSMGMNKIRLTGGEPLVRKDVMKFIEEIAAIDGLNDIRITTNGVLLAENADKLYELGIRRLNISLDSLQKEKFAQITGVDVFEKVWKGIMYARDKGFKIKLNVVAMHGINDDEFIDFAKLSAKEGVQVRFIEFMPLGEQSSWSKDRFISAVDIEKMVAGIGKIKSIGKNKTDGPARVCELVMPDGSVGNLGFISPISHHFCDQCNRLRLTSEGTLRSCLLNNKETDLKALIRNDCKDEEISEMVTKTILDKPKGHTLPDDIEKKEKICPGQMSRIGG